jgi:hypothetical protein
VLGQGLDGAVHGGQTDAGPARAQHLVELLGAAELVDVLEQVQDLRSLTGLTCDHDHRVAPF